MDRQRKPHPHSIEVILGLTDTNRRKARSFRPYCKWINEEKNYKDAEYDRESSYTKLVPRRGLVPKPLVSGNIGGRTLDSATEQRVAGTLLKDSLDNTKNDEKFEHYPLKQSVGTVKNLSPSPENRGFEEYQRNMKPGIIYNMLPYNYNQLYSIQARR